jgi:hypothetical protein
MRGRVRRQIDGREGRVANVLPRRTRFHADIALHRYPRRDPNAQSIMRLIELDPRHSIAEEIMPLTPLDGRRLDIHRGSVNALSHAVDGRKPQHVARMGDR